MGKSNYSKRYLSQCHFVHHKSHTDRPGIKSDLYGGKLVTNPLNYIRFFAFVVMNFVLVTEMGMYLLVVSVFHHLSECEY
jgi:hypothetical protein